MADADDRAARLAWMRSGIVAGHRADVAAEVARVHGPEESTPAPVPERAPIISP